MMILAYLIIFLVAAELTLLLMVRRLRSGFQWLITEKDEFPDLDRDGLKKFFNSSYDPNLGWVRKPKTSGVGKGRGKRTSFSIDAAGARTNPEIERDPLMAAFGDSYVFCRQVDDHETWQVELTKRIGRGVMNFGVGNYGADQGLIRYEQTELPESVDVVVLGFVPETVCRVHSYWKHYLEFGNTFAFKPRFVLDADEGLKRLDNPMQTTGDFDRLKEIIPLLQENDGFYNSKFRSLQFRFPYLLSYLRNPVRHTHLIGSLLYRGVLRMAGRATSRVENLPFKLVMEYNIRDAHRMYRDPESTRLLTEIILRFRRVAEERGHKPLVLVMPQLLDLTLDDREHPAFQDYFERLSEKVSVIDMTDRFKQHEMQELYIEDQYGGHLSLKGNRLVADEVARWLQKKGLVPETREAHNE